MEHKHIYLFHGKRGSPDGTVLKLENHLWPLFPQTEFHRPQLGTVPEIEPNATIIGVSLGGLMAAKMQEARQDLTVVALSSPAAVEGLSLQKYKHSNLLALYSSLDTVIRGRTNWQDYTNDFYDVPWMEDHNLDSHIYSVAFVLSELLQAPENAALAIAEVSAPGTLGIG